MSTGLTRDFWKLWAAAATSNIGDGIRLTALPLLIAAITRDPLVVSGVTAATFAPWAIFSLPGGALVDRMDRRKLMVAGQLVRGLMVGVLGFAILAGIESVLLIYVTAFVIGTGEVFVDTSSQAAIQMLVPEPELAHAHSKHLAVEFVTNDALGGPVGAWLFSASAALPFLLDSTTFLMAGLLITQIRAPLQDQSDRPAQTLLDSIREGVTFVRRHALLRGLALAVASANLAVGAGSSILVLLALDALDLTEFGFGLLIATGAVGGFLGALLARRLTMALGRRRAMTAGAGLLAAGQLVMSLAPTGLVAASGFLLGSFGVSLFSVVGRALRQAVTPDRILGRVVTTFRLIGVGALPIGALTGGWLADSFDVRVSCWVGAGVGTGVNFAVFLIAAACRC